MCERNWTRDIRIRMINSGTFFFMTHSLDLVVISWSLEYTVKM